MQSGLRRGATRVVATHTCAPLTNWATVQETGKLPPFPRRGSSPVALLRGLAVYSRMLRLRVGGLLDLTRLSPAFPAVPRKRRANLWCKNAPCLDRACPSRLRHFSDADGVVSHLPLARLCGRFARRLDCQKNDKDYPYERQYGGRVARRQSDSDLFFIFILGHQMPPRLHR